MKFSLVNGQRQEARPNLSGTCPRCERPMTAKCGELKAWHWAHRGKRDCDPWWENETEWHRAWKEQFPVNWQEVVQYASDGEKHIADVKTDQGWVIEFQHSRINPEERRSRNTFYKKLAWVVDGARLQRDLKQFNLSWREGVPVGNNPGIRNVSSERCAILKEWSDSNAPVFFDFGIPTLIWWLHSRTSDGTINVVAFSRVEFINIHHGKSMEAMTFDELIQSVEKKGEAAQSNIHASSPKPIKPSVRPLVPRHLARRF